MRDESMAYEAMFENPDSQDCGRGKEHFGRGQTGFEGFVLGFVLRGEGWFVVNWFSVGLETVVIGVFL